MDVPLSVNSKRVYLVTILNILGSRRRHQFSRFRSGKNFSNAVPHFFQPCFFLGLFIGYHDGSNSKRSLK